MQFYPEICRLSFRSTVAGFLMELIWPAEACIVDGEGYERSCRFVERRESQGRGIRVEREWMRVCFLLKVSPEKVKEYKTRHAQIWPEMLDALSQSGWRNYSIFLRPDGLLVGYLEADDFEKCRAAMKNHPVNARWQAEMSGFFEPMPGGADDNMFPLDEVFHLD
jgi:L-rhamnose mutarotase